MTSPQSFAPASRSSSGMPCGYRWVAVAIVGMLAALAAGAEDAKDQKPTSPKPLVLFDGKTLDGWKEADYVHSGGVKVDGGSIILNTGKSMTGLTSTRTDLPKMDFEFSYEAKRVDGRDFFAAATFPVGNSFLTFVNGGWGGSVTGLSSLNGSDASENETNHFVKYENNTWYKFRVRVSSDVIRCWIDDKELIVLNHKEHRLGTRIESRACQPLGFATWETSGALRNISIRPLTAPEVTANNKTEQ